jgi:hypothetical protein
LKLPSKEYIKLKALTAEGIAINSVVGKILNPKMDSYQKQTYDAPHNSQRKPMLNDIIIAL